MSVDVGVPRTAMPHLRHWLCRSISDHCVVRAWEMQLPASGRVSLYSVCMCWLHLLCAGKAPAGWCVCVCVCVPNVPGPGRNAFLKELNTQHST